MWEYFTLKRAETKKILEDVSRDEQEGTQGQWQQESPFREALEQVKRNTDLMWLSKYASWPVAMRHASWEVFKERCRKEEKSSEWALVRIREAQTKSGKG